MELLAEAGLQNSGSISIQRFLQPHQVQINFLQQALSKHVDDLVISMSYEGRRKLRRKGGRRINYQACASEHEHRQRAENSWRDQQKLPVAEELGQAWQARMRQLRHLGHAPAPVPAEGMWKAIVLPPMSRDALGAEANQTALACMKARCQSHCCRARLFPYTVVAPAGGWTEYGVPASLPQTTGVLVSQPLAVMPRLPLTAAGRGRGGKFTISGAGQVNRELLRLFLM